MDDNLKLAQQQQPDSGQPVKQAFSGTFPNVGTPGKKPASPLEPLSNELFGKQLESSLKPFNSQPLKKQFGRDPSEQFDTGSLIKQASEISPETFEQLKKYKQILPMEKSGPGSKMINTASQTDPVISISSPKTTAITKGPGKVVPGPSNAPNSPKDDRLNKKLEMKHPINKTKDSQISSP